MYGCLSVAADHLLYVDDINDVPPTKCNICGPQILNYSLLFWFPSPLKGPCVEQVGFACIIRCLFIHVSITMCLYYIFIFYYNVWKMDIVLSWHHYINIATNLSLRLINHYLFINILIDTMRTYCTYYIVYNGDDCIPVYMHLNAHAAHHRHRRILHE